MKKLINLTIGIIGVLCLSMTTVHAAPYKYHGYIYEGEEINNVYYKNKDNTVNQAKIYMRSDSTNVTYSIEYDKSAEGAGVDDYDDTFDYRQTNLTKSQTERMNLIGYYGYNYKDEEYDHTDIKWYAITQYLIWQEEGNNNLDSIVDINGNKKYAEEIEELENLLKKHSLKPDFGSNKFKTKIYDKLTIEDKNKVIKEYEISKTNNANYNINDNVIDITTNKSGIYTLRFNKKDTRYTNSPTFFISNKYCNAMQIGKFETITSNVVVTSISGKILITKAGEQLIDYQDNKFIYKFQPVKGSVYYLYAKDDIYSNEGTLLYNKDEKVSELTTGEKEYFEELYPSTYYVKEIVNAYPYLVNNNTYDVSLDLENNYQTLSFSSKFQNVTVSFKNFRQNPIYENGKISYSYLLTPGNKFGLYSKDDIYSNVDSITPIVKRDTLLGTSISNESGIVVFDLDIPLGSYYIKNLTEDEKYYGSYDISPFIFSFNSSSVDRHYTLMDYYNLLNTQNVNFSNIEEGERLNIYDKDKNIIITDNLSDNKSFSLPYGTYYYQVDDGTLNPFVVNETMDTNITIQPEPADNKVPDLIEWEGNTNPPKDEEPKKDITQNVFQPIIPNEDEESEEIKKDETIENKEEDKINNEKKEEIDDDIKDSNEEEIKEPAKEEQEDSKKTEESVEQEENKEENIDDKQEEQKPDLVIPEESITPEEPLMPEEPDISKEPTIPEDTVEEEIIPEEPTISEEPDVLENNKEDIILPKDEEDITEKEPEKTIEDSKEEIPVSTEEKEEEEITKNESNNEPSLNEEITLESKEENIIEEKENIIKNLETQKEVNDLQPILNYTNTELNVEVPKTDKFDFIIYASFLVLLLSSTLFAHVKY